MGHTSTLSDVIWLSCIICILRADDIYGIVTPGALHDYCLHDYFNAECQYGTVVIMEQARFGRMRLGTCLHIDIGFLDCSSDVLLVMDQWCSGRQSCSIQVSKLGKLISPCPHDVTSYLQASFTCLPVTIPPEDCCNNPENNVIHVSNVGFIGSSTTEDTGCGNSRCPWILQVSEGQQINITLMDFGTYNYGIETSRAQCLIYALIKKDTLSSVKRICAGITRQTHVHTTTSYKVKIEIVNNEREGVEPSHFLLRYEAIGCPNPELPFQSKVKRTSSPATIECSAQGIVWEIECRDNQWQGDLSKCHSETDNTESNRGPISPFLTQDVYMVFVVAIAVVISVATITTGIVCLQRCRYNVPEAACADRMDTINMYSRDGAYQAQEFVYNTSTATPSFHKENYIYYLNKKRHNQSSTSTGGERENDNGYYSDHTYESPVCDHLHVNDTAEVRDMPLDNVRVRDPRVPAYMESNTDTGNELTSLPRHSLPKFHKQNNSTPYNGKTTM